MKNTIILLLIIIFIPSLLLGGGKWYHHYQDGLDMMNIGAYNKAIGKFQQALKVRRSDAERVKTYGMHFIEYYPHRELGICYYELGEYGKARIQLNISLKQSPSTRAQEYLNKLQGIKTKINQPPPVVVKEPEKKRDPAPEPEPEPETIEFPDANIPDAGPVKLVGERMGIAVLPFQTQGLGEEMGEINIVEQMMTTFYNLNRFKLYERTQLESILEEQKLGMTGLLDASTAAEIGKGIGVDAIVLGTVTRSNNNIAIDARLIDTESAQIITAQDEVSERTNIQALKATIQKLAMKIVQDLPLINGFVIDVSGDQLTLDVGSEHGIKRGMKCVIFKEGDDIIHPITKAVLGKQTEIMGEVKLTQVYRKYSVGNVVDNDLQVFEIGNKIVTK